MATELVSGLNEPGGAMGLKSMYIMADKHDGELRTFI